MFGKRMIACAVAGVVFCGNPCCASPMCCGGNQDNQGMSFADRSYNVVDHGKSFPTTAPAPSCCDSMDEADDMGNSAWVTNTNSTSFPPKSTMDDYRQKMCSPADDCCANMTCSPIADDLMCTPCTPAAADNSTSNFLGTNSTSTTSFNNFNTTAVDDMCCAAPGTCAPPADSFQSAEDMFNSTNTCGDGLSGMMCGIQQNFTSFFGGNNSTDSASSKMADDNLDSCDSDLQDSL